MSNIKFICENHGDELTGMVENLIINNAIKANISHAILESPEPTKYTIIPSYTPAPWNDNYYAYGALMSFPITHYVDVECVDENMCQHLNKLNSEPAESKIVGDFYTLYYLNPEDSARDTAMIQNLVKAISTIAAQPAIRLLGQAHCADLYIYLSMNAPKLLERVHFFMMNSAGVENCPTPDALLSVFDHCTEQATHSKAISILQHHLPLFERLDRGEAISDMELSPYCTTLFIASPTDGVKSVTTHQAATIFDNNFFC